MRIYIIGSDGITLCRKATATLNDGEIAVASNEELHAAPLSAKRLLALFTGFQLLDSAVVVVERLPRAIGLGAGERGFGWRSRRQGG